MNDLKELTYIEVMKIFLSFIDKGNTNKNYKEAKQVDVNRLLGG